MCAERRKAAKRFYDEALNQAERSDFPVALEIDGVDDEIALLRLRLRSAVDEHPEDLPLMFRGIDLLTKAVITRYRLSHQDSEAFAAQAAELRAELKFLVKDKAARAKGGRP